MIFSVQETDLEEVRKLIAAAVRQNVASSEEDATFLIDDIDSSLTWWSGNKDSTLHLKYEQDGRILGVILIKEFWNLTNLFVHPDSHGAGIGRALMQAGFDACRERSPKGKLLVNSSANAVRFFSTGGSDSNRSAPESTGPVVACLSNTSFILIV